MKIEYGKLEGNQAINSEFKLHGIITGDANVLEGGILYLHGIISGNLIVETGATAILNGMVSCKVTNNGGTLQIYGTIFGV